MNLLPVLITILSIQTASNASIIAAQNVTANTVVHVPSNIRGKGYSTLVQIAITNHLPLGIVLNPQTYTRLCAIEMTIEAGSFSVTQLISNIKAHLPHTKLALVSGVIEISPTDVSKTTSELLSLEIPTFRTESGSQQAMGNQLWTYVRSVVAPNEGTAYAGGGSQTRATVEGFSSSKQTTRANLDLIVTQGHAGAWVFETNGTKSLQDSRTLPYRLFSLDGDGEQLRASVSCSR